MEHGSPKWCYLGILLGSEELVCCCSLKVKFLSTIVFHCPLLISVFCKTLLQGKCKAAYFVIVLNHLRSVVIAVRGTETPEDLITDSLCRECRLLPEDLDGLIKSLSHKHTKPIFIH